MAQKTCIIILGMHRSGTSALAGSLSELGIDFGKNIVEPSFDNPKGFFENEEIQNVNDSILEALDIKWDFPGNLETDWQLHPEVKKLKSEAQNILNAEFADATVFCIKDPRMCHLLPFWLDILKEEKITTKCLFIVRHPKEVAASLSKRNNISSNKSYLVYTSYLLNAFVNSNKLSREFISYSSLLAKPNETLAKALGNLKLTDLSKAAGTAKLTGFLSKKMRHYDAKNNLVKEKDVISYLNSTFQALNALTTNTKSTSKHLKLLGENYKTHSKNSSIFYENIVTSKKSFFKVFIDSGKGFNEKQTIVFPVQSKMHSWDLKKISKYKTIQRVKLTPANTCLLYTSPSPRDS